MRNARLRRDDTATIIERRPTRADTPHFRAPDRARLHRHGQGAGQTAQSEATFESLDFEDRLGLLVDREAAERDPKRLIARLKFAALRQAACVKDPDMHTPQASTAPSWPIYGLKRVPMITRNHHPSSVKHAGILHMFGRNGGQFSNNAA